MFEKLILLLLSLFICYNIGLRINCTQYIFITIELKFAKRLKLIARKTMKVNYGAATILKDYLKGENENF